MKRINSTRFMTQEELAQQLIPLDLNKDSYPQGGIPLLVKDNEVYVDASDSHSMIFGATGSKKTRMFVMPSIGIFARSGESFVVTDPKGELYQRTAGEVRSYGYNVYCMNLRNFKEGVTWNPLSLPYDYYHKGKRTKAMEFITEMASMIIGEDAAEESFWINSSIDVLCGFILLLFEMASQKECNLRSLVEIWKHYLKSRREVLRFIKENYGSSIIYQKISSLDNASDKTVGSVEAFINMGLNKLSINEEFMDFLSQDGINLEEIIEEKMAIYLVIPDENKSYHFVVSLFLEQLYEVLINKAQGEIQQQLPLRMNFLIDEFGNIPKIDNMDAMITAARSRNIRFQLIVQGMKQLKQKYGDGAEIISGNCNNWIYLYSKEYDLLQEISRLCGDVIYDNNVSMPLFSAFDLQHLSKEKGEALILAGRNCPCISNLADIDEYPYKEIDMPQKSVADGKVPISVCSTFKKKNYCYSHPLEDIEIDIFCGIRMPEMSRWVVGVGPEGMILLEGKYTEKQIRSGYAFHQLVNTAGMKGGLEIDDLEWYSAEWGIKEEYETWLKTHPGAVCATISVLGESKFKLRRRAEFKVVGEYFIDAAVWDDEKGLESEIISTEAVEDFGGALGLWYVHNKFFMLLNDILDGTDYEKISWQNHTENRRDGRVQFEKRIDDKNYIIGSIWRG